jgi:hypothetical protein
MCVCFEEKEEKLGRCDKETQVRKEGNVMSEDLCCEGRRIRINQ